MNEPHVAILGAGGLIGQALAEDLLRRGFAVHGYGRRFSCAQRHALGNAARQASPVGMSRDVLAALLQDADIVVNCIGVLQGAESDDVHRGFVAALADVCAPGKLLIHLSVPGDGSGDRTPFSLTKRAGERAIAGSGAPFVILRPGFVIGTAAYGGSAQIRALAALPFSLPAREARARFAATAMSDICETVAWVASQWRGGVRRWQETWDVMEKTPGTVGQVIAEFRARNGGPAPFLSLPGWTLPPAIFAGDLVALLGWRPPLRRTAIAEMRRGVTGDPAPWMAATGITPRSMRQAVALTPATIQEKWFARLYLLKAAALIMLVIFWCLSGLIALTVSYDAARGILLSHGYSRGLADGFTIVSSLMDISVGLAIAWRRTARIGLVAGVLVSLGYMAGCAVLTPELWLEPLGALVKTGPAIVLMLFCLAMMDDR